MGNYYSAAMEGAVDITESVYWLMGWGNTYESIRYNGPNYGW
jgi:hypothetical protein